LGGLFGVVTGLVATLGFTLYVGTLGNYNATYGALAGVVVFLMWLWIFDIALLLGVEVNQEVLRRRKLRNSEEVDHARQEGP
jgi:membrane protein